MFEFTILGFIMVTSEQAEFVIYFVVPMIHLRYFFLDRLKFERAGCEIRANLHFCIFVLKALMVHAEHREVRFHIYVNLMLISELGTLLIDRFGILFMGVAIILAMEEIFMIRITCQNSLSWLWNKGKEVLDHKVARLTQLALFLLFFGHRSILISVVSLVYDTWDDYLSQIAVGIEGVYEEFKEMAKTKFCEKHFKVPDGLNPQNRVYTIRNKEFCGFSIVELRIETRALPDSDPEGVRCIRCFGMVDIYGEWFPLPSALAG